MALKINEMLSAMLDEVKEVIGDKWPEVRDYAESELKKLGENLLLIEKLRAAGEMSEEEARLYLDMQKLAMRNVLISIEGIGIITAERAINAALGVVRDSVNKALGFALL